MTAEVIGGRVMVEDGSTLHSGETVTFTTPTTITAEVAAMVEVRERDDEEDY